MDRITLSSLVGNIVVIGLDGNIRTLAEGESPKPGELIIEEVSDTSELVVEQVTPQGSSINVTDDITALIEAIGQGQDPTQLGEDFETAAGGVNGSSPQNTGAINRTGAESLASTNFETVGINGTGFSSTQVQTLFDIFQPQAPAPQEIPIPAEVVVQEISSPTVNEGEQVTFDVTLDQATEIETNIELSLDDGSANGGPSGAEGVDYVNTTVLVTLSDGTTQEIQVNEDGTFSVSLPIGVQSFTVSLDSVADDIYEGPETFTLTGATPDQETPVSGTATVLDDGTGPGPNPDDDRPEVSISDADTVDEGTTATFTVTLSSASEDTVQVQLALNPGETEAGDLGAFEYNTGSGWASVPVDGTVTVPAGMTEFEVRVATLDDEVYEGPEDFSVTVTGVGVVQGQDTGTATIVDDGSITDDDRPSVSISDEGLIDEGNTATFTVTLSNASDDAVQVQLTLNPEATETGDLGVLQYNTGSGWADVPEGGTVTVPAGMTEFDVRIATIDDEVYEGPEDFSVTVTGVGAVQGQDTGTATIVDDGTLIDDDRPSVSISDEGEVDEGSTATFTVTLSNASEDAVQVQLSLNPEETEAGDLGTLEYNTGSGWVEVPVGGLVTVPAGMTEFDVRVASISDDVYEGPEDFSVTVTGVGVVQGQDTGTATIVDDGTLIDDDRPSVSISDEGLVDEGNTATFTVTLSTASEDEVQVQLALNPEETEAGDLGTLEYNTGSGWVEVPVGGLVTVPAGMKEFDVRIATIDDEVYEGPEDFSVTVTGVGVVQGQDTGTATIVDDGTLIDDDRPNVSISDEGLVDEGNTATFTVTLSSASEDAVQVQLTLNPEETETGDLGVLQYNTGSGWADVPEGGTVTVPAGMTEFDVRIATIGDDVYEGPEDFSVTVTGVGVVQGQDTGTATIVDDGTLIDDDRPSVSISDEGLVDEGNTATFTVTLSNASEDAVQVQLALNPEETEVGDLGILEYNTGSGWVEVPVGGLVTVPAGMTEFDVRIATIGDDVYEGPEDFSVTVTGVGVVQGQDTGTATIVDDGTLIDDDRPSVSIVEDSVGVNEGTDAVYTVKLSAAADIDVTVRLNTSTDGSNTAEADDIGSFVVTLADGVTVVSANSDGTYTIPAGQTELKVTVPTTDDDVYEGDETFTVAVQGDTGVLGRDSALGIIYDGGNGPDPDPDDDRPSVSIVEDSVGVNEGTDAVYTVKLSAAADIDVTVRLNTSTDGSNTAEADDIGSFVVTLADGVTVVNANSDGTYTIPAGQTELKVTVPTTDDDVYEGDETFTVAVQGDTGVVGSDSALGIIYDGGNGPDPDPDDDRPSVSIVEDSVGVNEGTDAVYTVKLSAAADIDVTVRLNTSTDGSNTAEADDIGSFVVTLADGVTVVSANSDGTYTIPAGQTELKVTVPTTDDDVYEGDETFTVAVQGDTGVLGSDSALGIIYDGGNGPDPDPDDDRPSVSIVEDSVGVNEGTDAVYTVKLSAAADIDVTVRLNTSTDGSNTAEADDIGNFVVTLADGVTVVNANSDGTYTIPAGETELKVTVPTTDDDVYEGDETFTVAVQGDTGVLGSDSALGIIYDGGNGPDPDPDDDRPSVSIVEDSVGVNEGTDAVYTVKLSAAADIDVTVRLNTSTDGSNTAEADDIGSFVVTLADGVTVVNANSDGTYTIPAGETELKVTVPTTDDDVYEGDETFTVAVQGDTGVLGSDTALGIIYDGGNGPDPDPDDDRPSVFIVEESVNVDEGNDATFTVRLSAAADIAVTVNLRTLTDDPNTAEPEDISSFVVTLADGVTVVNANSDGTYTIPAGETDLKVVVPTTDDSEYEGDETFTLEVTAGTGVLGSDTSIGNIIEDDLPNTPPTARDFIISLNVQDGIFPVQDVDFDGLTSTNEQRVEDLEDDANGANDADLEIVITALPEHGELYYLDNGVEVIIDQDFLDDPNNKLYENTDIKYRLTDDFFDEQSFDSADLLEDQGKDILVGSYTPPNSNLTFTGGQIITIGNSIIFDSDAQISVDFANQQVGLYVVSPDETGQGDEIATGEYITLELDEDLSANEAKLNLASLNDRFNSGAAWLTAYIFLNGALVDVQQFYSTDINYTSNHEGFITVAMENGSFDEIRLTPETNSSSDKAGFTLVGTEITSFTDVNDDFTYQAIDTDGAVSNEATVSVDFNNVTAESVATADYNTQSLTLTAAADAESNIIMGDEQDNELVGTSGNDILIGGLGDDILTGGEGDDVFKWTEMQSATDTVADFETGDQLDFADLFEDVSQSDISLLLDDLGSGDFSGQVDDISITVTERGPNSTLMIHKGGMDLEVNFDGASAADIANSLISNLEHLRE